MPTLLERRLLFYSGLMLSLLPPAVHAGLYVDKAAQYATEIILAVCFIVWLMSVAISTAYKPPMSLDNDLPKPLKAVIAMLGGILALLYAIHVDKAISVLHPFWVVVVTIMAPATFTLLYTSGITFVKGAAAAFLRRWPSDNKNDQGD